MYITYDKKKLTVMQDNSYKNFIKERRFTLSLDQFLEEASSEEGKGFEPASPENLEETVLLRMIINDLIKQVHIINPKYGRILDLICEDYTKGQILEELHLGKSQGYADIKAAQELAKKLYFGE